MELSQPTFSILITSKNRKSDLAFTLEKIKVIFQKDTVECVVFDDGFVHFFNYNSYKSHN